MVWEQEVRVIAMITHLVENGKVGLCLVFEIRWQNVAFGPSGF